MKLKSIKFFTPEENSLKTEVSKPKPSPTGYISPAGKLVLPSNTLEELGIEPETARFKIGTDEGKRKIKSLYLVPSGDETDTFTLARSGRGYVIPLAIILKKGGIDFAQTKYVFTVSLFNYDEGVVGYELVLASTEPKPEYTGKPRGRKAKVVTE